MRRTTFAVGIRKQLTWFLIMGKLDKKALIANCLYYKGETHNPLSVQDNGYAYWEIEWLWVNDFLDRNSDVVDEYVTDFLLDFPYQLNDITKSVPLSLKALLYHFFSQRGGMAADFHRCLLGYMAHAIKVKKLDDFLKEQT